VGIRLVVEVLDHYHGPDHKFRWLVAFAESANDRTRMGWPSRELMAARTGKSPSRVSHMAGELAADGVIRREGGGGRNRGSARYVLMPLVQGASKAHSENPGQGASRAHSQGASRAHSQGARPTPQPAETVLPNPSYTPQIPSPSGDAEPAPNAQVILASFIDWDRARGGQLTRRVTGQLGKHIAGLLAEGIDDRYIRIGLADWRDKNMHPSTLDSFVNAAMNGHTASPRQHRPSTGDRAIAEGEALKAQLRNHRELA
jgi:hypothetical protein